VLTVSALIVSVLTRCVLTISSRIVSVLIIGGWMMSVLMGGTPTMEGRRCSYAEPPHGIFFALHFADVPRRKRSENSLPKPRQRLGLICHVPRPTRHRQRAEGHA
jgi:hypothetical protein